MKKEKVTLHKFSTYKVRTILERVSDPLEMRIINGSKDAYEFLRPFYEEEMESREKFIAMYLNRNNRVIGHELISIGGITGTVADVRLMLRSIIEIGACGLILSHNHPSGNLNPSQQDADLTNKIKQACKYHDVALLDHIILTYSSYHSFSDCGAL
jgi:DNA repair protein RadC